MALYRFRHLSKIGLLCCIFVGTVLLTIFEMNSIDIDKFDEILKYHNHIKQYLSFKEEYASLQNLSTPLIQLIELENYLPNHSYFHLNRNQMTQIPGTFSIPGSSICHDDDDITLLILVLSVSDDKSFRLRIRQTWASGLYNSAWQQKSRIRLAFMFGDQALDEEKFTGLRKESEQYGDIVAGHFQDSYANLSLKMETALTWAAKNCPQARMVAKVDMDTFVNIPLLLALLSKIPDAYSHFVLGYQHVMSKPIVERNGRWAVSEELYPFQFYPRYVYGHSYVLSRAAVQLMVRSFSYFHVVPNEDAFITGIIPVVLNITRFKTSTFAFIFKTPTPTFCDVAEGRVVTCLYRQGHLEEMWQALNTGKCRNTSLREY